MSAGIDAFRLGRPLPERPVVSRALDGLSASAEPSVVLAGLTRLSLSVGFADGCGVELTDGVGAPFRAAAGPDAAPAAARAGVPRTVVTPLHGPARGRFASFSGLLTHWWHDHEPDEHDRLLADVLVRHAVSVVDRQRLVEVLAEQEERSSRLTMQAITGRWTDIATGLVMRQFGVDTAEAEEILRDTARQRGTTAWDLALEVVHTRGLTGDTADPPARPVPLRAVPPTGE